MRGISLITSLRIHMILFFKITERTFQGYSVKIICLLKHTSSLITFAKKKKKKAVCAVAMKKLVKSAQLSP